LKIPRIEFLACWFSSKSVLTGIFTAETFPTTLDLILLVISLPVPSCLRKNHTTFEISLGVWPSVFSSQQEADPEGPLSEDSDHFVDLADYK